jgi:GcrA cell cycle regulator
MPISSICFRTPAGNGSGWNDERVDLLKQLWADGLPANKIAVKLGGVTRNAVIGKVHRLGLAGRKTTSRSPRRTSPRRTDTGRVSVFKPAPPLRSYPAPSDDLPQTPALMLSVVQLTGSTCHWPIGDPRAKGFGFCGASVVAGGQPYCATHQRNGHQWGAGR